MVSSGSTPPLNRASRIASCSACIVRSSSFMPCGLPKPLASSRSESFDTRSSRSRSSRSSPVNLVYRYFMNHAGNGRSALGLQLPVPSSQSPTLVVILLLAVRDSDVLVERRLFAARAAARRRFGRGVAALVAAADLLLCVQAFENEVDRRRERWGGDARRQTGALCQLAQALHAAGLRDHIVGRRVVAERQRAAEVEPL